MKTVVCSQCYRPTLDRLVVADEWWCAVCLYRMEQADVEDFVGTEFDRACEKKGAPDGP